MKCNCGSGKESEEVYDARNIYVCKVCDKCRAEKLSHFRKDIFSDTNYWHDEPIEEDF